jgi:hypothetical protein
MFWSMAWSGQFRPRSIQYRGMSQPLEHTYDGDVLQHTSIAAVTAERG